jgi:hypothetical protein
MSEGTKEVALHQNTTEFFFSVSIDLFIPIQGNHT